MGRLLTGIVLAVLCWGAASGLAQADELRSDQKPPVRLVVAGSAPFHILGEEPRGLSVEVWDALGIIEGRAQEWMSANSVREALEMVERGDADVAIGPISITDERAKKVDFSQPYYVAALAIAAAPSEGALSRLRPFLTLAFVGGVGALLVVLFLVGSLVWLAERRGNPEHFPARPLAGIGNGIWMTLVTMTTVGYGDLVPRTTAGRLITGVWMVVAMIITTSLVAFMATAFTVSQLGDSTLDSATELRGRRVAAVTGTTSVSFAEKIGARVVKSADLAEAVQRVADGEADAVVFDRPTLRYFLREHPQVDLVLSVFEYEPTGYGFAVALGSPLRHPMDVAVLRLQRTGELEELERKWLGPATE